MASPSKWSRASTCRHPYPHHDGWAVPSSNICDNRHWPIASLARTKRVFRPRRRSTHVRQCAYRLRRMAHSRQHLVPLDTWNSPHPHDADNPLFWVLLWVIVFGIVPTIVGWMARRDGSAGIRRPPSSTLALVLTVGVMGPLSLLPPPDQSQLIVLFRPDATAQESVAAIAELDGRSIGSDSSNQLWAVDVGPNGNPLEFYRYGAMLVSNSLLPLGCFNWTKV